MSERIQQLRNNLAEWKRQSEGIQRCLDAWHDATPSGLTADQIREAGRRFHAITEQIGPRRGLVRFGRRYEVKP